MDPNEYSALASLYKRNPSYFSDEDYDALAEKASQLGSLPPEEADRPFSLGHALLELGYGGIKGATGFIDPGANDKPQNFTEDIFKSVGELGGFLGLFFTPIGGVAKALGWGAKAAKMERMVSVLSKAERFATAVKGVSVPMKAGEYAMSMIGAERAAKVASTLGGVFGSSAMATTLAKQAFTGGVRMAAAGAVSSVSIFDGRSLGEYAQDAVKSGAYGMAFGGIMDVIPGSIGTLPFLKDRTNLQTFMKAVSGAIVNGAPIVGGGGDLRKAAYEGIIGAYFGSKAHSWREFRAYENLTSQSPDLLAFGIRPEENPIALKMFKGREDELRDMGDFVRTFYKTDSVRNIMASFAKKVVGAERFNKYFPGGLGAIHEGLFGGVLKAEVGDYIRRNGVNERLKVTEVVTEDGKVAGYTGVHEDGSPGHIPVTDAIEDAEAQYETPREKNNVEGFQITDPSRMLPPNNGGPKDQGSTISPTPETVKTTSQTEEHNADDFEAPRSTLTYSDALKRVVSKVFGMDEKEQSEVMTSRTQNLELAIAEQARKLRDKDPTARGINGLLEEYLHLVPNRTNDITIDDLHPMIPYWNTITQSINIPHMYYTSEGVLKNFVSKEGSPMALDAVGNIVDTRAPRYAFHAVSGDDRGVIVISGFLNNKENGDIEYTGLHEASLSQKDFVAMSDQLYDKGYYLFSGGADKPVFLATKFIDDWMTPKEMEAKYQEHLFEMEKREPGYRAAHMQLMNESGMTPERYKRIIVNNILYYERMNNMPYVSAMDSGGMIKDLVSFNKRVQPLMTNFYQLDKNILAHFDPDHELNYNMILVHDDDTFLENTDGGTTVHPRNIDIHHKAMGIPEGESHTKSFIYGGAESGRGMHIIKHAEHRATSDMARAMDEADVGYIARPSGVKQYGNRKIYHMRFEGGKLIFSETKGGEALDYKNLERTLLKPEDFRIASSIHDDALAHLNKSVTYPKQASYHLSIFESGLEAMTAHMAWIVDRFQGTKDANDFLQDYVEGRVAHTAATLQRVMDNFHETGVKNIISAMESNETLRERFMEKNIGAQGDFEDGVTDGEGIASSIPEGLNGVKRQIAAIGGKIPLLYTKEGRKISEQAIARLFVGRLAFPKIKTGGKGIMYMYEPGLAAQINGGDASKMNTSDDRLTEHTFFLGETKRKMRLEKGAVLDENNNLIEGKTTLEKQYEAYEKAEQLLGEGKIDQKTFDIISDATHFTVTRVPMDSFSGTVRLRFAGFTGEEGGHILLHANVKRQLGGADNDIDSAYYFHGLPKAYHTALENARGNFQKYAEVTRKRSFTNPNDTRPKGSDEERIFFTDHGDLNGDLKRSKASMLDPIYRASLGHAVSKGRGAMLPVAVRYVDIMKKVVDTAYEKGGVFELKGKGGVKVVLEARDYDAATQKGSGETLGAYGQRAINSAADAGKEAGMVSQEEMKAILTASAFQKISVITEDGTHVLFDASREDFSRDNHKTVLSDLKDFVGLGVKLGKTTPRVKLMDTEVGLYNDFIKKLFGYNHAEHRPYNLNEVAEAAKEVEGKFTTPYNAIIPLLAEARYSDGLIERIAPNRAKFIQFLKQAHEFSVKHPLIADSILPRGVYVEYEHMERHLNLYSRHFDPSPERLDRVGNLATIKGMKEFSADDVQFNAYLGERLSIWEGAENQMTLDDMQRKYGAFYKYNEKRIQRELEQMAGKGQYLSRDLKAKVREKYKGKPDIESRVRFLSDERYQVSDYISSRINDVASGAFVAKEVNRLGITKEDMPFIQSSISDRELSAKLIRILQTKDASGKPVDSPTLLDLVKIVKYGDATFHKKEWDRDKSGEMVDALGDKLVMSAQEALSFSMDNRLYLKMIADAINEGRAKRGAEALTYGQIQDLYHTLLVSTVLKGGDQKTGQQRLGLDTVPDRIIEGYSRVIDDVYSESLKGRDEVDFEGYLKAVDTALHPDPWHVESEKVNDTDVKGLSSGLGVKEKKAEAPSEEVKAEEPPKPPVKKKSGIAVLKSIGMDLRGAYFKDPNKKLSRKEREIADTFARFMKKHKTQFGDDLNNFISFLNGIMSNSPNNPNQWTLSDLEGAFNRIKDMERGGSIIDLLSEMFTKEGSLPFVNWATWLKFPVKNAERLQRDKNAFELSRIPVFDSQGNLNPEAVPKTYVDDKGVKHEVYMDELLPTNVLHRNYELHKSGDAVIVEIEKKARALFEKYLPFLNGGVVDPVTKVDHSDTIFKAAAYTRERDAALRTNDKKREETSYARLRALDDVESEANAWKNLKTKELHIIEAGETKSVTGEEAVRHVMEGMENLNEELAKWIKLDTETLGKYFVLDAQGKLDHEATKRNFLNQLHHSSETVLPYDAVRLFDYMEQVRLNAEKGVLDYEPLTRAEVMGLKMFDHYDELKKMHPSIDSKAKAEFFINHYDNELDFKQRDFTFDEETILRSPLAKLYKEAKLAAAKDMAAKDPRGTKRAKLMRDLSIYLRAGTSDEGNIPETDIRSRLFKQTHYNQYEKDLALAEGKMSAQDYYQEKLMNAYRFKDTELMEGWFPHRNFDKKTLQKQLILLEAEIRGKRSFSKNDEEHFNNLQDAYRRIIEEDYNPGSTDDGMLYDSQLLKDGVMPMMHVISQKPAALSERTVDLGGFSTHPYEMVNAVMSVMKSGNAKLISTLNNDNILKFERRELSAGAPKGYTRGWVTYLRQFERQAFNRASIFTNEMLSDPVTKIKWTPAYWFSDHAMVAYSGSRLNRMYREVMKADQVTDVDKAIFFRKNKREMTKDEEAEIRNARAAKLLDFSKDKNGEYTPQALKNMENAARIFKRFSQFEAKIEMSALLFHPRFAVSNLYGGISNDFIYNGIVPIKNGHDIKYWNGLNDKFKTMDDVHRWFEDVGVLESIILKDTGYQENKVNPTRMDKVTEKASFFLRKTEPWLRREAAMHGYMAARESLSFLKLDYDSPILIDMARKSVEASQFLYNNYNRPYFMSTNMGKIFTRFRLWGLNSLKMQGDIMDAAAYAGYKKGTPEMGRFQRMMMANIFMAGLAMMLPHTIFQTQLPQPVDTIVSLSQALYADDEVSKKKRKNLFSKGDDPIRDVLMYSSQLPGVSFPLGRVPLAVYDLPQTFRAIWSNDVHAYATASTLNMIPFGRFTRDFIQAYQNPSMAAELMAGIPLHRVDGFYAKARHVF